jgi:hypothetical protein
MLSAWLSQKENLSNGEAPLEENLEKSSLLDEVLFFLFIYLTLISCLI